MRLKISLGLAACMFLAFNLLLGMNALAEGLKRTEPKYVCMITNKVFPREQIPTVVEGKTYYGCCAMCAEKLTKNAEDRSAIDPVTGAKVDKATAVIGATGDGTTYYFESEKSLNKFSST